MFKGRPVTYSQVKGYRNDPTDKTDVPVIMNRDGSPIKIWFPLGPGKHTPDTEVEDPAVYNDAKVQAAWAPFLGTGKFTDGVMPLVPPKRDWCLWDF
jgi:nucleoporin NUP42